MPSRLKDLRLRFPYDDQDFREKYTPGHVSPSSLKYTGDESKGPRAANASLKNNHPVFIFPHHDSDGSQNLFYVRRRTYLFTRSIEPRYIARHWRFRQENIHRIQLIYAAWPSESWPVGLPSGLSVWVGYASCTSLLQGKRRSWSRLCGSLWFVCAGVERASREGSSYIYTSSTLTSRWHQRGQALWRTTGPPINLATFLFSILDSKRRLGTFKVFFGLILLILFSFLMALFFDWKVVRVLMVVGLSSPLSKSSFILFYSWCFCTPKAR